MHTKAGTGSYIYVEYGVDGYLKIDDTWYQSNEYYDDLRCMDGYPDLIQKLEKIVIEKGL